MPRSLWEDDSVQFSRLIAEVWAVGVEPHQWSALLYHTGLGDQELVDVFKKADHEWERLKEAIARKKRWLAKGPERDTRYPMILYHLWRAGLRAEQFEGLAESMDLDRDAVKELFLRAADAWMRELET